MAKRKSVKKTRRMVRRPVLTVSQAFAGGSYDNLNPASVTGLGSGGATGYEFGKYGALPQQWTTVMDINSKTLGNSFDMPIPSATPTAAQLLMAQGGGSRRRRKSARKSRRCWLMGGQEKAPLVSGQEKAPLVGGQEKAPLVGGQEKAPLVGGARYRRRSRKYKRRGGTGYRQL